MSPYHKIRINSTYFEQGDIVYFKRASSNKRHGLGTVIGQDRRIIFVRHGSNYVRVSTSHLITVSSNTIQEKNVKSSNQITLKKPQDVN